MSPNHRLHLAAAGLACLSPAAAHAQVIELNPIVVEGTNLEGELQPVQSTGSAVSVVTGEELQRRQIRNAGEALRGLPGVSVNRAGGIGNITQVRIRGAEANHTLVLIDGVEANTASEGEFDFSNLLTEDIERIEVIRGPQSGLYGSNALAGVINIVTYDGRGPFRIRVRGEGGSFATGSGAVSLGGGTDAAHGAITVQRYRTEGFNISPQGDEDDGADIGSLSAKGGIRIFDWLQLDGVLRHVNKFTDRDDQLGTLAGTGELTPNQDTPSNFRTRLNLAGLTATIPLMDGHWVQKLHTGWNETKTRDEQLPPAFESTAINESSILRNSYISTFSHDMPGFLDSSHSVTGLVEHESDAFTPVTDDNIERTRNRLSYAAEYRGTFLHRFDLAANVRHDDNDSFVDFTTYRVAGSWNMPQPGLRLHASVGTGVKYPTMIEQFGSFPSFGFVSNPNLLPEESFGWDAGVEKTMLNGRLIVDTTYFNADLENKIQTVFSPVFTAVNLPGTSTQSGIEVSATYLLMENLKVGAAYTHLDARLPDGREDIRQPEHSGSVNVDYGFAQGRGNIALSVEYNGDMQDDALRDIGFFGFEAQRVTLDAYTLVNLAASYEVKPGVELFGRVENLLDEDYQEIFGFETAGLAGYGGVRFTIGGE